MHTLGIHQVRMGPEVAQYPAGATFGPRRIPDFEFVWVLGGGARYTCDETEIELRPGVLLLIKPGSHHHFAWRPDRATLHAYVHFSVIPPAGPGSAPDPTAWPVTRAFAEADLMLALCHHLLRLGPPRDPDTQRRITEVLNWLLTLFVDGPVPAEAKDALPSDRLSPVVTHLRDAWRDGVTTPVPLPDLARVAGVSPSHLARLFRRHFGLGPVHAIELVRLARAATLLQRSNMSVSGIATACGFASPFHFSRRFRLAYGEPPRQYASHGQVDPLHPLAEANLLSLAQLLVPDAPHRLDG